MLAHSGEIIDEIARRSGATHCAQFFSTDFVIEMPGSAAKSILRNGRTRRAISDPGSLVG